MQLRANAPAMAASRTAGVRRPASQCAAAAVRHTAQAATTGRGPSEDEQQASSSSSSSSSSRRQLLLAGAAAWAAVPLAPLPAAAGTQPQAPEVGTYLPPAGIDDFVLYVPGPKATPAIRAGTIKPDTPYRFALPPSFREGKVANIQSGNYCQPRCAEPWTEVIFESQKEGKVVVIVSPLVRLTNRANAAIQDIGPPEGILSSLGAFITGTYLDEESIVSTSAKEQDDGRVYYFFELDAPYGTNGPHTYSAVTTKGDLALMFVAAANDKQWPGSRERLIKAAESFRA